MQLPRRPAAHRAGVGASSSTEVIHTCSNTHAVASEEWGEPVTGKNPVRLCSKNTSNFNFCGTPKDRQARVQAQRLQSQARGRYNLEATPEALCRQHDAVIGITRRAQVMAGCWPAHVCQCWSDSTVHEALCYCKSDMSAAAGSCHQLEQREAEAHRKLGEQGGSGSNVRNQRAQ